MCILDCAITLSTLFVSIGIIICFLDELLVIMLSLGFSLWLELFMTLWISEISLGDSFRKASLILIISLMLFLKAWVYDWFLDLGVEFKTWFFLKNLDLAKMLLLGLGGIDGGILEISTCLLLDSFLKIILCKRVLLNCEDIHCLKVLFFLLAVSLSQPVS